MKVAAVFLCDYAQARDGLLFVIGGAINSLTVDALPTRLNATLAVLLDARETDTDREHRVDFQITGPSKKSVLQANVVLRPRAEDQLQPRDLRAHVPLALQLRDVSVASQGVYRVRVSVDGGTPKRNEFWIGLKSPIDSSAASRRTQTTDATG